MSIMPPCYIRQYLPPTDELSTVFGPSGVMMGKLSGTSAYLAVELPNRKFTIKDWGNRSPLTGKLRRFLDDAKETLPQLDGISTPGNRGKHIYFLMEAVANHGPGPDGEALLRGITILHPLVWNDVENVFERPSDSQLLSLHTCYGEDCDSSAWRGPGATT